MESSQKVEVIRRWMDPAERATVDFEDEKDLNAVVVECDEQTVSLLLETAFPHYRQQVTLSLSALTVGEDKTHYTRDPEKPLRYGRLRLNVDEKRPLTV